MKTRAYVYEPSKNTLTITKAFEEKLQNPNSEEYKIFRAIKADNPAITIRMRTHKTKAGYVNQYSKLTYKHMEAYIRLVPKAEELLEVFNTLRTCAQLFEKSPYTAVRKWFADQCPKYREDPMYHLTEKNLTVISPEEYVKAA